MNLLEALKSKVQYPMPDSFYQSILIGRSLDGAAEFTAEVSKSSEFKGAYADCLIGVATAPNVSEGGVSISVSDSEKLVNIANSIYTNIGEKVVGKEIPTVTIGED